MIYYEEPIIFLRRTCNKKAKFTQVKLNKFKIDVSDKSSFCLLMLLMPSVLEMMSWAKNKVQLNYYNRILDNIRKSVLIPYGHVKSKRCCIGRMNLWNQERVVSEWKLWPVRIASHPNIIEAWVSWENRGGFPWYGMVWLAREPRLFWLFL